jgi:competence protein ComGC
MGKTYQKAKAMDVVLPLKQLVDSFYVQENRYPISLRELVDKGYIKEIPKPPTDREIYYNPATGAVSLK